MEKVYIVWNEAYDDDGISDFKEDVFANKEDAIEFFKQSVKEELERESGIVSDILKDSDGWPVNTYTDGNNPEGRVKHDNFDVTITDNVFNVDGYFGDPIIDIRWFEKEVK